MEKKFSAAPQRIHAVINLAILGKYKNPRARRTTLSEARSSRAPDAAKRRRPVPRGETMGGLAKEAGVFRRIATGLPPASMGRKHAFVNGAFARQYKRISKNSVYDAVSRFNWIYGFTPFFMMSNTAAVVGQ